MTYIGSILVIIGLILYIVVVASVNSLKKRINEDVVNYIDGKSENTDEINDNANEIEDFFKLVKTSTLALKTVALIFIVIGIFFVF